MFKRSKLRLSRIGFIAAIAVTIMTIGPVGVAAASEPDPEAIQALAVVPGLQHASNPSSPAHLVNSGQGFSVNGATGTSTTIQRVNAKHTAVTHTKDGQAVADDTSTDTDTVVQGLSNGARIIEVIRSSDAPKEFTYKVDVPAGMKLIPQTDGSVLIGTQSQAGDVVTINADGMIGAPWAVDANGKPVPASYKVSSDGVITMHVEHSKGVAYPIVADPSYSWNGFLASWGTWTPWNVNVYLNKARSEDAADGGAVLCVGLAFVPVIGGVLAAICGVDNILIRAAYRYGWCELWNFNLLSHRMTVSVYRGGFCT